MSTNDVVTATLVVAFSSKYFCMLLQQLLIDGYATGASGYTKY